MDFHSLVENSGMPAVFDWIRCVFLVFVWILIIAAILSTLIGLVFGSVHWFGLWGLVVSIPIALSFLIGTIVYFVNR